MILITGGTGTSGRPIVEALLNRGERPRVLARDPEKAAAMLGDDVEIARGDFTDAASLDAAMEGVETGLLLSPPVANLVELESGYIDAAKRNGIARVVKFSAFGADTANPMTALRLHGIGESTLKDSGLAWTMLRPPFFMQNFLGMAGTIKAGAIYLPTGEGRAAFADVRDIAAVAAAALSEGRAHDGKSYDITGPQSLSNGDAAAIFTRVLGREVKHVDLPPEAALKGMIDAGMPPWNAQIVNELSAGMKSGFFDVATDNVRKIGNKEPVTLEQFIRENRSAFQ